jgi:hypothetical protein
MFRVVSKEPSPELARNCATIRQWDLEERRLRIEYRRITLIKDQRMIGIQ